MAGPDFLSRAKHAEQGRFSQPKVNPPYELASQERSVGTRFGPRVGPTVATPACPSLDSPFRSVCQQASAGMTLEGV